MTETPTRADMLATIELALADYQATALALARVLADTPAERDAMAGDVVQKVADARALVADLPRLLRLADVAVSVGETMADHEEWGDDFLDDLQLIMRPYLYDPNPDTDEMAFDPTGTLNGRLCAECLADLVGNDPHGPDCTKADQ
jgi:hypothetical protein